MAPRRRRLPSFYVILLNRSASHLRLPAGFVRKHLENNIPEDPILLSDNGGHSWSLKIKKDGDNYCFADGWNNVVEDSLLEFGDFLLFLLIDQSTFKFSIFGPNGCAKMFPPKTQVEDDDHDEDESAETREEVEEEVDDDGDEDVEEEEDDYDDDGEEEEEEDEETDEEEEEEEEEEDGIYDEEEDDGDEDDDSGGEIDGNDGDPFFMKKISKSDSSLMRLPMGFARLAGVDGERNIKMKNLEGEEWSMSLRSEGRHYTRYYLSVGWAAFMRANQINEGDKCAFKFLRGEDKLCLAKVTKKRVPGQQSTVKIPATKSKDNGAEVPVVEVLRTTRGQPPRVEVVEKNRRVKRPAGEVPVGDVFMRTRGKRRHVEVESEDDGREVVKRKTRAAKQEAGKAPVTEVLKRLRGRPPRVEEEKAPVAEVLKRKRGRPFRVDVESKNDGENVVKRGRGSQVEVVDSKNDSEKVVTRSRGRPFKRLRVDGGSKNEDAKAVKRGRWPSRVVVESKNDGEKVEKRPRGRPFKKKRGRGRQPK